MTFAAGQEAFAAALLGAIPSLPPCVAGAHRGAASSRFQIYRNNVFVGLTQALARRFPVTERLVGSEFFAGMARVYAQERKPTSPLLMEYGEDFPEFIAGFAPAATLGYLPDVARLEAAWTRSYHAADMPALDLAAIGSVPPEALAGIRFALHPAAALVHSPHPVGSIWAAHREDTVSSVAEWTPETVLVARPDMTVGVSILPRCDAPFAAALFAGATLGEAAEASIAADDRFEAGPAIVGLVQLGAFSSFSIKEDLPS